MQRQNSLRLPTEITREGLRKALIKFNKEKEANNEILLDKMLYVLAEIHRVSLNRYFRNEDGNELTHLQAKYLKANLGRSGKVTYKQVIDYLLLIDVIEVDNSYKASSYSKSYGLKNRNAQLHIYQTELKHWHPPTRSGSIESTIQGKHLLNTIEKNIQQVCIDREYVEMVNMSEVNMYAILSVLYNINSSTKRFTLSALKKDKGIKNIYVKVDDYGRVHHNTTGIGRKYRPALTIDGEHIYSVDLSASQLYFSIKGLTAYAKQKANSSDWKVVYKKYPDVPKFIDVVLSGKFYQAINEYLGFTEQELKANKIKTLMPIFSKKDPKRKTQYLKALEAIFPTFLAFINTKKKNDYADAAKFLQGEESKIMIEKVCARLMNENVWFVPVHDCILCKEGDITMVRDVIEHECVKYNGLLPHTKTSDWTGTKAKLNHTKTAEEKAAFLFENSIAYREHKKMEQTNRVVNKIKKLGVKR